MLTIRLARALLTLAFTVCAHSAMAADPVRIGALYPLSGQGAKSGEDTLNGIRLAIDIINNRTADLQLPFAAGEGLPGLGNAKIELIAADHQGSPEIGAAEAERLIVQRKVAALIGAFHSSVAATSSQVAERLGVQCPVCEAELEAALIDEVPACHCPNCRGLLLASLEFRKAVEEQGLDYPTLKAMVRNSLDHAFADDVIKARLRADLETAFRAFERRPLNPRPLNREP